MDVRSLCRTARFCRQTGLVLPTFLAAIPLWSLPAHATLLRACRPTDTPLVCRLQSFLTLLDAAAIILAALLIVAILAAVRAYRRKGRKLSPDDITPDAK